MEDIYIRIYEGFKNDVITRKEFDEFMELFLDITLFDARLIFQRMKYV